MSMQIVFRRTEYTPPPVSEPACAGQLGFTVYPADRNLLEACGRCQVQQWCFDVVDPRRSGFDGICAGRVWSNGRPVR